MHLLYAKKTVFFFLCFIQILVIVFLGYQIYYKTQVSKFSISPINKNDVLINPNQNLEHFFENKPDSIIRNNPPSWFKGIPGEATINSDGLNERFNYPVEKDPSTYRVITLGDSFTYGWFVNTNENYPEKLEDKLNNLQCKKIKKFEVINLGVGGYDIEYAAHHFDLRGAKYQPNLIIWLIKADDFIEISDIVHDEAAKKDQELKQKDQSTVLSIDGSLYNLGWNLARDELQKKLGKDLILKYQAEQLYTFVKNHPTQLVIFTYNTTPSRFKDALANSSKIRPGVFFSDFMPDLHKPDESFPDGHPTAKGYSVMSSKLFDYLTTNQLLPCN